MSAQHQAMAEDAAEAATFTPGPADLADALAEIGHLQLTLELSIIGSRIIVRQFERAETPILQWAYKQALTNMTCDRRALERSREEFPRKGRAATDAAKAGGAS